MCFVCGCVPPGPFGMNLLNHNRVEVSEAHDDIQRDRRAQVISIQAQVPQSGHQAFIIGVGLQAEWADHGAIDALNGVVVEVQVLQVAVEQRHRGDLVVG